MPFLRAALLVFLVWSTAFAQCELQPLPGDPLAHATGSVTELVAWDPDGAGPSPQVLVAGGKFSAGTLTDVLVAIHDGSQWLPLGTPVGSSVTALTVWNGLLVVATITGASTSSVSTWNGSGWVPLGAFGSVAGRIRTFTTFNTALVAGGQFTAIDGNAAANVAQFDGSGWTALGSGTGGQVNALGWFAGSLHVGGDFTTAGGLAVGHHAIWNGSTWFAGGAFNAPIDSFGVRTALAVSQTYLIAGGRFTSVGSVAAPHVARLTQSTGLWTGMGAGIACTTVNDVFVRNIGLSSFEITVTARDTADDVWRWNGTAWTSLGSLSGELPTAALATIGYVGGYVLGLSGANQALRKIDGAFDWPALLGRGLDERVTTSCSLGNQLVIGGWFRTISGVVMNGIARGNPGAWQPLGTGFEHPAGQGGSWALAKLPNGDLVAGGDFTTAGGVPAGNLARWDGTSWSEFGGGVNDVVRALAVAPGGDVFAAGRFTTAGGLPRNRIARWNGTTWLALGTGASAQINALHVAPNGELLVGGEFTAVGGILANRVARWNGAWWSYGLGTNIGVNQAVYAITTTPSGEVVIGGAFTANAFGAALPYVAKWNGTAWVYPAVTVGYQPTSPVHDLDVLPDGDLLACGEEWTYDLSVPPLLSIHIAGNVARLDAQSAQWGALDVHGSIVEHVRVLPEGAIAVGGIFGDASAANFAKLMPTCPAAAGAFGVGCSGNTLTAATAPWVNTTFRAVGTNLPANAIVLTATSLTPVPQGVAPLAGIFAEGLPGCDLLVAPDILSALVPTNGTAISEFSLPDTPPLVGVTFFHQMIPLAFGGSGALTAVTATNALQLTVGFL